MKIKQNTLLLVASVVLVIITNSCASAPFSETTSLQDNEMTTFQDIALVGTLEMEDLKKLGTVEATRTIIYILEANGDYTIEMGDYNYSYVNLSGASEVNGTRVVGKFKTTVAPIGVDSGAIPSGLISGLLGGIMGEGPSQSSQSTLVSKMDPKTIALEAVNYDLMTAAAKKGGVALLLPEYAWEIKEEKTGTATEAFLFLAASKVYSTKSLTYTVTARATAVSF